MSADGAVVRLPLPISSAVHADRRDAVLAGRCFVIANPDNPGTWLRHFRLGSPVVSCASAAEAKGVPVAHELKTLVIDTDDGLALAHLRGDRRLALHSVRRCLKERQARLADRALLDAIGVEPGTIFPFHFALWGLPHLISREVLSLSWVTTNAGSLDTYIVFDPILLLRAADTTVADLTATMLVNTSR